MTATPTRASIWDRPIPNPVAWLRERGRVRLETKVREVLNAAVINDEYIRRVSSYYNADGAAYGRNGFGAQGWFQIQQFTGGASLFNIRSSRYYSIFNSYVVHANGLMQDNVAGANGIQLQPMDSAVDQLFLDWFDSSDITGESDGGQLQRQIIKTAMVDGECLCHLVVVSGELKVQILDTAMQARGMWSAARRIYDGIEYDQNMKPLAFYFRRDAGLMETSANVLRIPAENIVRIWVREFTGQTHGLPWLTASVRSLDLLSEFDRAVLERAKNTVPLTGYWEVADRYQQENMQPERNRGLAILDPNEVVERPEGYTFHKMDFAFPTGAYSTYRKAALASGAVGGHISYFSLSSDLEGANYSSLRHGKLDDVRYYQTVQALMMAFLTKLYFKFLAFYRMFGSSMSDRRRLDAMPRPVWIGPAAPYIDPEKEVKAQTQQLANRTIGESEIISNSGRNPGRVFEGIARDKETMKRLGITKADVSKAIQQDDDQDDGNDDNGDDSDN